MSSTNKTTNLELSQYVGSDKPTYLVDYNGDMAKIDAGYAAVKSEADATDLAVSGLTSTVSGLSSTVSDQGSAITGLRTDTDSNTGSINTINSLIGNGTPTTEDKTIIGAINEIYAEIGGGSSVVASAVSYDNQTSGLTADDVQEALDEIVAALPTAGAVELQTGTLTAGQTSVVLTFAEQTISATSLIDVYVEDGINYTAIATTSTTVTLTFEAQAANKAVAVRVTN